MGNLVKEELKMDLNVKDIVIPELEEDVVVRENESGEEFSIMALINAIIKFINNLIKFEF